MIKKAFLYSIFSLLIVFCSCSNDSVEVEYLPCQLEEGQNWGFVSPKGQLYLEDQFSECPTPVVEGVFFVREGDTYTMYEFDKKKPEALVKGLSCFGMPHDGLVPICRVNHGIEVVDMDGEKEFDLSTIEGQRVVCCSPRFVDDMLKVYSVDNYGNTYCSVVDDDGEVVLSPKYEDIQIVSNNLFYVVKNESERMVGMFIDDDEEEVPSWSEVDAFFCSSDKYIAVSQNERCYIYTYKGKEVLKCSEKVQSIVQICGKNIIYRADNGNYGVMNTKGDQILMSRYCSIQELENGKFLTRKNSNLPYELLSKHGERLEVLSDYDEVLFIDGFGVVASDGGYFYVLNRKFKPAGKMEYARIEYIGSAFRYGYVVSNKN